MNTLSELEVQEEKDRKVIEKLYDEMNALVDKHIDKVRSVAKRNDSAFDYQTLLYNLKKRYLKIMELYE